MRDMVSWIVSWKVLSDGVVSGLEVDGAPREAAAAGPLSSATMFSMADMLGMSGEDSREPRSSAMLAWSWAAKSESVMPSSGAVVVVFLEVEVEVVGFVGAGAGLGMGFEGVKSSSMSGGVSEDMW